MAPCPGYSQTRRAQHLQGSSCDCVWAECGSGMSVPPGMVFWVELVTSEDLSQSLSGLCEMQRRCAKPNSIFWLKGTFEGHLVQAASGCVGGPGVEI